MHSEDEIRLRHMLDAALEADSFSHGRNRSDLDTDRMLVLALLKDLEIVGDAASRVSLEAQAQHADIREQHLSTRNVIMSDLPPRQPTANSD